MAKLSIHTFGSFQVTLDGKPVTEFESSKVRALLIYLAVESDRPHSRDSLIGLIWPNQNERSARRNLSQALFNLRTIIRDRETSNRKDADSSFLQITRQNIQFKSQSDYWLDVRDFREHITASENHPHTHLKSCVICMQRFEQVNTLYQGEFLDGFFIDDSAPFSEWVALRRERYHRQILTSLSSLTMHHVQQKDYERARQYAFRQVELDPWREEAHAQLIWLLAQSNQRSAAIRQYEICRQILADEFGVEPAEEITALYRYIRDQKDIPTDFSPFLHISNVPLPACPYQGLHAFREENAHLFFGRESYAKRFISTMQHRSLVAVIGSSGSGKSSVVFAGVIPALPSYWHVVSFRPGQQPFQALSAAVIPLLDHQISDPLDEMYKLAKALQDGNITIADLACEISARCLVLIIDQFEEIYTLCNNSAIRQRFLDLIVGTVRAKETEDQGNTPLYTIVLTMRADFMEHALTYRPLVDILQDSSMVLGPMTRQELRRAVENPAQQVGVSFEAGLVERILDDVGKEPGRLPLLEFTLSALWERQAVGNVLTHETYEAIGQVSGSLACYADRVFSSLNPNEQERARHIFLQMVQPGEWTEDTRRLTDSVELGEDNWQLISRLADARLVVTGRSPAGQEIAELAHEALIYSWDRLQAWLGEDRSFRTWQERVRVALCQWKDSGGDQGALLRGALLVEAEEWNESRPDDLSPMEQEFIHASIELRERESQAAEAARQRELAQAQSLAETEHRRAEEQAKASQRLRRLTMGLATVFFIAVFMAVLAIFQWQNLKKQAVLVEAERDRANTKAAIAQSQQLAAESIHQLNGNPELALLLAIEAGRLHATTEARVALSRSFKRKGHAVTILSGHTGAVTTVVWNNTEKYLATGSFDKTARIWDAETGTELAVLNGHTDRLIRVAWEPSGKRLLTTSQDGTARIWDIPTRLNANDEVSLFESIVLTSHLGGLVGAAWNPVTELVLTVGSDHKAVIWDADSGAQVAVLGGQSYPITSAVWSPDGAYLLTCSENGTAQIWEVATLLNGNFSSLEPLLLSGHQGPVLQGKWSPDGIQLATSDADGTVRIWNIEEPEPMLPQVTLKSRNPSKKNLVWSTDGQSLFTIDDNGVASLWDSKTGVELVTLDVPQGVFFASWDATGMHLATAGQDHAVRVWNTRSWIELSNLQGHSKPIVDIVWNSDGTRLATASLDGTVRVWNPDGATMLVSLSGHTSDILSATFNGDGTRIATTDIEGTVRVWGVEADQKTMLLEGHKEAVWQVAWDWTGNRIVTAGKDGTARVWDLEAESQPVILDHATPVIRAGWDPAGKRIYTAGETMPIHIWDVVNGQVLVTLEGRRERINLIAWDPAGEYILAVCDEHLIYVWNPKSGEIKTVFVGDTEGIIHAAWSPDGTRLVSTSRDGTIQVWDVESEEKIAVFDVHIGPVWDAAWDGAGDYFVSAGEDGTARLWKIHDDSISGTEVVILSAGDKKGKTSSVLSVTWNEDDTRIAAVNRDGTIQLWDPSQVLETSDHSRSLSPLMTMNGLTLGVVKANWDRDGKYVVTIDLSGEARVWDVQNRMELAVFADPVNQSKSQELEAAAITIITASDDRLQRVYYASINDLLEIACLRAARNMTPEEWLQYMGDETYRQTCIEHHP